MCVFRLTKYFHTDESRDCVSKKIVDVAVVAFQHVLL